MKKKVLLLLVSRALCLTAFTAGTLAYFTDGNTFTLSHVDCSVAENFDGGGEMQCERKKYQ